ncbi:hypothetical protein B566_EDAN010344 [Ephemera danica]|nr:hypothetical protein B566_EDAN010344 [Ephemera danica]
MCKIDDILAAAAFASKTKSVSLSHGNKLSPISYLHLILDTSDVEHRLDLLPQLPPGPGAQLQVLAQVALYHLEGDSVYKDAQYHWRCSLPLVLQLLVLLAGQVTSDPGLHPGNDLAQTLVTQLLHLTEHTGTEEHLCWEMLTLAAASISATRLSRMVSEDLDQQLVAGLLELIDHSVVQGILVLLKPATQVVGDLLCKYRMCTILLRSRECSNLLCRRNGRWRSEPQPGLAWEAWASGSWETCPDGLVSGFGEHRLFLKDGEDTHGLEAIATLAIRSPYFNESLILMRGNILHIHAKVNKGPLYSFSLIFLLFEHEHVVVEELLKLLVGEVDAQLIEAIHLCVPPPRGGKNKTQATALHICSFPQGKREMDDWLVGYLLNQFDTGLEIHAKINKGPLNALALVFFLFKHEHVVVEELLQLLIGEVNTELLEAVKLHVAREGYQKNKCVQEHSAGLSKSGVWNKMLVSSMQKIGV